MGQEEPKESPRRSRSRSRDRARAKNRRSRSRSREKSPRARSRSKERERGRSRERDSKRRRSEKEFERSTKERERNRSKERKLDEKKDNDNEDKKESEIKSDPKKAAPTGGVYIPPFKLAMMQKDITDKSSLEYQKMTWEALKKSINGLINKVSASNIKSLIPELFYENLIRGRGLFCRSIMKAQSASPNFTPVYAAFAAVVNTKMPEVGELLLKRLIIQFRRAYSRNAKPICLASTNFLAHLANQQVVGVIVPLQICALLLEKPTDDSVEVAVSFITEAGQGLQEQSPQGLNRIFDRFRSILHEGEIDKRVQYTIEGLFAIRKTNFKDHPAIKPELDLVDLEDQITHEDVSLDDPNLEPEDRLNFFHFDDHFTENEAKYDAIRKEILGEEVIEELEGREDGEEEEEEEEAPKDSGVIQDQTETELINLRKAIYLTIMSSVDFNECAHKLLKIKLPPGGEMELCNMLIECCSQERTYMRFYGLLGQRFCMLDKTYQDAFDKSFGDQYVTIHRLETNKLRNVAKFFAHLLQADALPWTCLDYIRLTEEETTSSSRIFIKIIFQELAEYLGLPKLNERLKDPFMQKSFEGIFPKESPKNTRFAINFFTSIGLGGITDDMREHLKNAPKKIVESSESESESSSDSSDSSDSSSESDSDSDDSDSDSDSSSEEENRRSRRK